MGQYILNFLIAFDRMVNTLIGGNPSETLSSVAFRKNRDAQKWGFTMAFINWLFANEDHCKDAYAEDRSQKLDA